jgi:hypothetical protein
MVIPTAVFHDVTNPYGQYVVWCGLTGLGWVPVVETFTPWN